jgi:hypothetical protein
MGRNDYASPSKAPTKKSLEPAFASAPVLSRVELYGVGTAGQTYLPKKIPDRDRGLNGDKGVVY